MAAKTFSPSELAEHGAAASQILIGLCGKIYDVSERRDLYGEKGGYKMFAGHVVTRSFAKVSLEKVDVDRSNLSDLEEVHFCALYDWVAKYESKYPIVGSYHQENEAEVDAKLAIGKRASIEKKKQRLMKELGWSVTTTHFCTPVFSGFFLKTFRIAYFRICFKPTPWESVQKSVVETLQTRCDGAFQRADASAHRAD